MRKMIRLNVRNYGHMYTDYLEENSDPIYGIKKQLYYKILRTLNEKVVHELINKQLDLRLPSRLGNIFIEKRKVNPKRLKIDFNHYNKTGEKIYHFNEHTNNFYFRFRWLRDKTLSGRFKFYEFIPTRGTKTKLTTFIKDNPNLL